MGEILFSSLNKIKDLFGKPAIRLVRFAAPDLVFGEGTLLDFLNMTEARTDVLMREPTIRVVMDGVDLAIHVFEVTERL